MMNSKQNTPTTTTEELIVQYLDGELVRKELETVLFDRLAHSDEARMLLREYLVVRGAIRVSREDKQFQLSDDLDARTRARIVQIMEAMETEELLVPVAAVAEPIAKRGFKADQDAIASSPMSRQLKRWQVRGSLAALSLLLAVGIAWFTNGSTSNPNIASLQPTQKSTTISDAPAVQSKPTQEPIASIARESISNASVEAVRSTAHTHSSKNAIALASNHLPQNPVQANDPKADNTASTTESQDGSDVMILPRYGKAIDAASKHEVVVSGKDRL